MSPAAKKTNRKTATKPTASKAAEGFTAEEKAAMKERARELKAEKSRADGEKDLLAKIAEMKAPDRAMATRLHAIVKANAPALAPKTWYGMPAYANRDGKIVCFFQSAQKFGTRSTFGFNESAALDEGAMWPVAFALKALTAVEEKRIGALVKQATR